MGNKNQFWKEVNEIIVHAKPHSIILVDERSNKVLNLGNDEKMVRSAMEQYRYDNYSRSAPLGGGLFEEIQGSPVRSNRSRPIVKRKRK